MFNKLKEAIALAEGKEFEENALELMTEDSVFDDELYEFMKQDIVRLDESEEIEDDYSDIEFFTEGEDKEECKEGECEKEEEPKKEKEEPKEKEDSKKDEEEDSDDKEESDEEEKEEPKKEKGEDKEEDDEELDEGCCGKKAMNNEAFSDILFDKKYNAKRHLKKSHAADGEVVRTKEELKRLKRSGSSAKVLRAAEKEVEKAEKRAFKAHKNAAKSRIKVLGESSEEEKDIKKVPVKEIQKEMDDDVEIEELLESVCEDF